MSAENCLHQLRLVRERIGVLEREAVRPGVDYWDRCSPGLEAAAELLSTVERSIGNGEGIGIEDRAELRSELNRLRRDIARVSVLLASANEMYRGLAEITGLALAGYTAQGRVLPFRARPQLSVHG